MYFNIEDELSNLEVPSHKLPTEVEYNEVPKRTTKCKLIHSENFGEKIGSLKEDTSTANKQRSLRYTKIRVPATTITPDKSIKRIIYVKHPTKTLKRVVTEIKKQKSTAYTALSNVNNKNIPLLHKQSHNIMIPNSFKAGGSIGYFSNVMGSINKLTSNVRYRNNVKEESTTKPMTNTPKFPNINNNIRNAKEKSSITMYSKTTQPEFELEMFSGETSDTRESVEEKSAKKHHKHKRPKHKKKHKKNQKHKQKFIKQKHHTRGKHGHRGHHRRVKNNKEHHGKHRHKHPKVYEIHLKKHKRRQRLDRSHFNYEKKLKRYNMKRIHHNPRKHGHKRRKNHQHIRRKKHNYNYRRAKSGINASRSNYYGTKLKKNSILPKKDVMFNRDEKNTEDFNLTSSGETNSLDSLSYNSSSESLDASESNLDTTEYYKNKSDKITNNFTNAKKDVFKYDPKVRFNKEQEELSVEVSEDPTKTLEEGIDKFYNTNENNTTKDNLRHMSSESDQEHILKREIYRYFDKDLLNFKTKVESREENEKVLRRNLLKQINFKQVIDRLSQKLKLKDSRTKMKPVNEQSSYSDEEDILKKKLDRFG